MALSMYDISITHLIRGLTNMSAILDKGAAYAESKKFDSLVLAQARLFPDMHPLTRQVQIACDTAKGAAGRLAQVEVLKHADTETTFAELKARIAKTVDFLKTVTAAQLQGADQVVPGRRHPGLEAARAFGLEGLDQRERLVGLVGAGALAQGEAQGGGVDGGRGSGGVGHSVTLPRPALIAERTLLPSSLRCFEP